MVYFILGFECTKRLRKIESNLLLENADDDKSNSRQLVIVCSANADVETANLAYDAGVDRFLEKPLQMESFMAIYKNLKASSDD